MFARVHCGTKQETVIHSMLLPSSSNIMGQITFINFEVLNKHKLQKKHTKWNNSRMKLLILREGMKNVYNVIKMTLIIIMPLSQTLESNVFWHTHCTQHFLFIHPNIFIKQTVGYQTCFCVYVRKAFNHVIITLSKMLFSYPLTNFPINVNVLAFLFL